MTTTPRRLNLVQTGHIATVVVVVAAYVVAVVGYLAERATADGPPFSATALVVAIGLGAIYLALLVAEFSPGPRLLSKGVVFFVLTVLMLAIEFLLAGANTVWLISMPLVAAATTDLPPRPRWLIYIAAFLGVLIPNYLRYDNWEAPFYVALTYLTAVVFVVAFVRLTEAAGQAQLEAEQLAGELADANTRLSEFAVQAEELATIQERNRLAREIHDNLGHYLTVANVQIKAARALIDQDPGRAAQALDKAAQLTQEGLAAVRQSVSSLRESPLGRRALSQAVADLAAETQAAGIVAELRVAGPPRPLDPRAELTLYRAAQEGLTNVRKHARASRVDLTLDYRDPAVVALVVRDNGVGRSGSDSASDGVAAHATGFGLLGLQERARQLGGRVLIDTPPGRGYGLTIELPTTPEPAAEGVLPE